LFSNHYIVCSLLLAVYCQQLPANSYQLTI